ERHYTVMSTTRGDDLVGDRALVESRGPLCGDGLQRASEIALDQSLASAPGPPMVKKDCSARRVLGEIIRAFREHFSIALVEHETVARQSNGGRHQRGARARAVLAECQLETGDGSRNRRGLKPARAQLRNDVALRVLVHRCGGGLRRGFSEID